jgi:hypothetical protein
MRCQRLKAFFGGMAVEGNLNMCVWKRLERQVSVFTLLVEAISWLIRGVLTEVDGEGRRQMARMKIQFAVIQISLSFSFAQPQEPFQHFQSPNEHSTS